ncbi:hypothetical protein D3C76_108730 [compost metagenome]
MFAHAAIELELEGRAVEAVEILQIDIQRGDVQCYCRFGGAVGQMHGVIAQLHVFEQHLPRFARRRWGFRRVGSCRCVRRFGSRFGSRFRWLAGKQFLPVELAVGFERRPGFQFVAADLADYDLLFGQIHRGLADVEAFKFRQWPPVRSLDGEWRDAHCDIVQLQFGFFRQIEFVFAAEANHTIFEYQRYRVTHVGPERFHLAVGDFQGAFGSERDQAEIATPVDPATGRADGDQGHVGAVFGQGAEVFQLEAEVIVEKLDGFAGAHVLKVHDAAGQFDVVDAQREGLGVRVGRCRLAGRDIEQAEQVELAVFGEKDFGLWLVQLDVRQMQSFGPQTVDLQVGVQAIETDLLLARLADHQSPQGNFKAERVELDTLDMRRHRCVIGQLLIGHTQGDARQNQKPQQAVEGQSSQQGANRANQSFGHVRLHLSESECLGVWHAILVPKYLAWGRIVQICLKTQNPCGSWLASDEGIPVDNFVD